MPNEQRPVLVPALCSHAGTIGSTTNLYTGRMKPEQPKPGIHLIPVPTPYPVGPSNCFLIDGPEPVLVDCGHAMPEAEAALRAGLAEVGIRPADLGLIVLTHHHDDHSGGLRWLRRESGALVCGHPWNDYVLLPNPAHEAERARFYADLYRYCGAPEEARRAEERVADRRRSPDHRPLDRPIRGGDTVSLGGRPWTALETPGHAGTSLTLVRHDGVALVGDTLLSRISSNAIAEPPYPGQHGRVSSLLAYRASLQHLASQEITLVLPGHGPAFGDHRALIERRLAGQIERAHRLLAAIGEERHTVLALTEHLFSRLGGDQLFLGLSEVLGHLDLLETEGLATHKGTAPAHYARVEG